VNDLLAALRRNLHELECLAAEARRRNLIEMAVHYECDAAAVEARIATLEDADGNALRAPTIGAVA
jgi:hypothetical protein